MDDLEKAFDQEMRDSYYQAARLGYRSTYFLRVVQEHGGLETAHRLLGTDAPSEGLARMWELGRLDMSLEAIVLKPEYRPLFDEEERRIARERLAAMEYVAPWDAAGGR